MVEKQAMTVENWLEEHKRWKQRQRVGLLPELSLGNDSFNQTRSDLTQDGLRLVELSYRGPVTSRRAGSFGVRKSMRIRRNREKRSEPGYGNESVKVPIGVKTHANLANLMLEDMQTHRMVAYIKVPSPTKVSLASKQSTLSHFRMSEDPIPQSARHHHSSPSSRSISPLECRYLVK